MRIIKLYNRHTLAEIGETEVMNEPTIHEEINGVYTLNIEVDYQTKPLLNKDVLLFVDGQYFQIANQSSEHSIGSLSVSLNCEHINYEMIEDEDDTEEYEDTAYDMLSSVLTNTRFQIGNVLPSTTAYYKPSSKSVRQRLLDIANLFQGELVFDNFTIHLVPDRGSDKGLKVELGINQISIQESIDYIDGRLSYELDCIDLSKIPGHSGFSSVSLGDVIELNNPLLKINTKERVIAYTYNPFKKQTLSCTVGNYVNDITDYLKEEPEEEEEEIDPTANYYLSKFNIGTADCLKVMGVEIDNDSALPEGISASLEYSSNNQYTGVFIELKSQYSGYFTTIYKVLKDGKFETFDYSTQSSSINTWLLPTEDIVGIGVIVTKTPFTTFDATKDDFRQYGVNFTKMLLDPFREFKIGTVNCLTLTDLSLDNTATLPADIKAEIQYEQLNDFTGLFLSLKKEFASWYMQVQTFNKAGTVTTHNFVDIKDAVKTWTLPNDNVIAIVVNVMEKPPGEFVEGKHLKQVYGVKFATDKIENDYLSEFRIGDLDVLALGDVSVPKQTIIDYIYNQSNVVLPPTEYETSVIFEDVYATLKEEFDGHYLTMLDSYEWDGDNYTDYYDDSILGEGNWGDVPYRGWSGITIIVTNLPFDDLINNPSLAESALIEAYGVIVKEIEFDGLITVKCKDEDGTILLVQEYKRNLADTYTISAPGIDGYELVSEDNLSVELTVESPNGVIEYIYKATGGNQQPKKGYVMEFGIAQLAPLVNFEFENEEGYDEVKSVVHGLMGTLGNNDVDIKVKAIQTNGKYTGIQVTSNVASSSTSINIQAVCFNEVN